MTKISTTYLGARRHGNDADVQCIHSRETLSGRLSQRNWRTKWRALAADRHRALVCLLHCLLATGVHSGTQNNTSNHCSTKSRRTLPVSSNGDQQYQYHQQRTTRTITIATGFPAAELRAPCTGFSWTDFTILIHSIRLFVRLLC